jgi:hypothetical protein
MVIKYCHQTQNHEENAYLEMLTGIVYTLYTLHTMSCPKLLTRLVAAQFRSQIRAQVQDAVTEPDKVKPHFTDLL